MTPNDVKIVAENINDFMEVADGVSRLRKAVLTLAMSGKLVPQDKKDGTGDELNVEIGIQREKSEIIESRRKKKTQSLAPTSYKETLYDLPDSWKWTRVGDVCKLQTGATPSRSNSTYFGGDIFWLVSGDINRREIFECEGRITKAGLENSNCKIIQPNSVLIALNGQGKTRATVAILRIPAALNQSLVAMTPYSNGVLPEYIFWYLRSQYREMRAITGQDDRRGLNMKLIGELAIPLPPAAEQKRIVERVQQIMKQLDELETKKRERDEVRTRFARSAMQSLGKGDTKVAFDQLSELVKTPADIKELEGALLTLAVSGKLVPQNKKEGSGAALHNEIVSKRTKVRKQKEIEDKEKLLSIPSSWSWVRLEDVFDVRDGTHDSPKYVDTGYPLVTSKNLYYGKLDFLNVKYISEVDHKKISDRSKVDRDDILFAMIGSIGNPVIVDTDTQFSIKNVALFKYYDRKLSEPQFLLTYLKYAAENMRTISAGGVQSFVSLGFLRQYPFPLPPLAEQKRIVKKVEEAMVLIDRLKQVISEKYHAS